MDLRSANLVTNIAAKAQADLQPVYLPGPGQCLLLLAWAFKKGARFLLCAPDYLNFSSDVLLHDCLVAC